MNQDESSPNFWQKQLVDIDFSGLPAPPLKTETTPEPSALIVRPTADHKRNKLISLTMLAQIMHQLRMLPDDTDTGALLLLFSLPNGNYRAIFPNEYDHETLQRLAKAAEYFHLVIEPEEGL